MGNHSLIEISHDHFHRTEANAEDFVRDLGSYVRSGSSEQAEVLRRHDVRVIGMRHSAGSYVISGRTEGFPAQTPFEEELDEREEAWRSAIAKAKGLLAGTARIRTISDMRRLVVSLVARTLAADASIALADAAIGEGTRLLADPEWSPSRKDYEAAMTGLAAVRAEIEPRRTPN